MTVWEEIEIHTMSNSNGLDMHTTDKETNSISLTCACKLREMILYHVGRALASPVSNSYLRNGYLYLTIGCQWLQYAHVVVLQETYR